MMRGTARHPTDAGATAPESLRNAFDGHVEASY
jgi:hypothetical protein